MTNESASLPTDDQCGPRTKFARQAFYGHFRRHPDLESAEDCKWITGYVAALEDLPSYMLASLDLQ